MLRFDLENGVLPNDYVEADLDSVILSLNVFFTRIKTPALCSLHTVDIAWNENEVTWNNASSAVPWLMVPQTANDDSFAIMDAGDMDIEPVAVVVSGKVGEWQHFNVTNAIKDFIVNPSNNNGFILRSSAELSPHYYYSKEVDSVEVRPKLTFYMNGYTPIKKSFAQVETQSIIKRTRNGLQEIYIPYSHGYTIKLYDLSGKIIVTYTGESPQWFTLRGENMAKGVVMGSIEVGGNLYPFSGIIN